MAEKNEEPLRGEAAWRAEKERVAARNEKAYARGREWRKSTADAARARERAAERLEAASLPSQPV